MPRHVDMAIINTNKGIQAIHMHGGDDPRYCFGWVRRGPGSWDQRHWQAYGLRCKVCNRYMPTPGELEAFYQEQIQTGLDSLLYIEVK